MDFRVLILCVKRPEKNRTDRQNMRDVQWKSMENIKYLKTSVTLANETFRGFIFYQKLKHMFELALLLNYFYRLSPNVTIFLPVNRPENGRNFMT